MSSYWIWKSDWRSTHRPPSRVKTSRCPTVDIGAAELHQIEDYAFAVASDERFNQPNVTWQFMVVGNNRKGSAKNRARQADRPEGLVHDSEGVRVWARR